MIEQSWVPHRSAETSIDGHLRSGSDVSLQRVGLRAPSWSHLVEEAAVARELAPDGSSILDALRRGNQALGNSAADRLIDKLADPYARVILTGQQPAPFGGAAMVSAKIMGAVLLAAKLERETKRPVVPIFWNHSEDHDLDEVNRLYRMDRFETQLDRLPIAHEHRALETLVTDAATRQSAADYLQSLGYVGLEGLLPRVGERFAAWSARSLVRQLAPHAFVVFEPNWTRSLVGPLFARIIEQAEQSSALLAEQSQRLAAQGWRNQVEIDSLAAGHLFALDSSGTRTRLTRGVDGRWLGTEQPSPPDDAALQALARTSPERFSTDVMTRPLVQQWLFPVIAQVVGPAESAYLAQVFPLFKAHGVRAPLVWPRPSIAYLGGKQSRLAARLGLKISTLATQPPPWESPKRSSSLATFQQLMDAARDTLGRRAKGAFKEHPAMVERIEVFLAKEKRAAEQLIDKLSHDEERARRIDRGRRHALGQWMWPRGHAQERIFGPLALLAEGGFESWTELMRLLDPCKFDQLVLRRSNRE